MRRGRAGGAGAGETDLTDDPGEMLDGMMARLEQLETLLMSQDAGEEPAGDLPGLRQDEPLYYAPETEFLPDALGGALPLTQSLDTNTQGLLALYGFETAIAGQVPFKSGTLLDWLTRGTPNPADCSPTGVAAGTQGIAFADHAHNVDVSGASVAYATSAGYAATAGEAGGITGGKTCNFYAIGDDGIQHLYGFVTGALLTIDGA